jgi:hypothetical protein
MNIQINDTINGRIMGTDDLGGAASLTVADMGEYAEMLDRTYLLNDHFADGGYYEVCVWDCDDVIWSADYVCRGGRLVPTGE